MANKAAQPVKGYDSCQSKIYDALGFTEVDTSHVVSERYFYKLFKNLIPWEVEKNLIRLASSWTTATEAAVLELRHQAIAWVRSEISTLSHPLENSTIAAEKYQIALREIENYVSS